MANIELYYYEMQNIIKAGNLEKIKQIMNNYGLSYSDWDDGYRLLTEACVQNQSHLAEYMLSKNVKINCDYDVASPLLAAVINNNEKLVKLLLEHGAKAYTNRNKGPLQIAIKNKNFDIVKLFYEHNAVVKSIHELSIIPAKPALYLAVLTGEYSIVRLILENGFRVNISDFEGSESMYLAIELGFLSILQLLLEFDVNVNAKTEDGDTLLSKTLFLWQIRVTRDHNLKFFEQDIEILKLLLDYNADINIGDQHNRAILYYDNTFTREHFIPTLWDRSYEHKAQKIEALISQISKLQSQNLYVSAGNLQGLTSIKEDSRFMGHYQKCQEELLRMVDEKVPNTTISLYNFITKSDNYLASFVNNDNVKGFVLSNTIVNRFPIYGSTVRNCYSRGARRKYLLEESVKIFENNWPYASDLLPDCLIYIFRYLNNNDLRKFIWMFE